MPAGLFAGSLRSREERRRYETSGDSRGPAPRSAPTDALSRPDDQGGQPPDGASHRPGPSDSSAIPYTSHGIEALSSFVTPAEVAQSFNQAAAARDAGKSSAPDTKADMEDSMTLHKKVNSCTT